ncbi:MAG: hypothetical protein LUQ65_13920, partial [Candidatus Helarchaeota archaeon]|nr:hypothetical protein [Candidatus Helarchaeota archaeon]
AFFFHGAILMAVSIWEAPIWNPGDAFNLTGSWDWHWGFWGLTQMFLIPGLFLAMFVYAQSREENYQRFGKKYTKEAVAFLGLVIGNFMAFGPLEDFGCYVIWGLDKFYAYAPLFHGANFVFGVIPTLYLMIIPGVILQTITLLYSRKFRKVKTSVE